MFRTFMVVSILFAFCQTQVIATLKIEGSLTFNVRKKDLDEFYSMTRKICCFADEGKLWISGGRIVNDDSITNADIFIEGGIIKQIGQKLTIPKTSRTIDASGMFVMPGGIDPHVHFKLPTLNINSVDDFYTGTKAALSGGTTMIIDSVTPAKNESLIAAYERYRSWADPNVACDYGLSMVVREFDKRVKLEMSQVVKNKGVNSFKFYMAYVGDLQVTDRQLYQGLLQCKDLGALARVHAEVGDLIYEKEKELLAQGITGPEGHIQSRPEEYQTEATSRACLLAKEANCPLYIVHVMSKGAADAIGNARKRGAMVFGEAVGSGLSGVNGSRIFDPAFRTAAGYVMSPPISRDGSTSEYLMDSLAAGQLHTTASDHAVFDSSQKALGKNDFTKIPNGVNGVEERMMLVWDKGVNTGKIDPMRFVAITSTNAAKLFNVYPKKGRIAVGSDADIVIWNPIAKRTLSVASHQSNSDFNIFEGITVTGSPRMTISRGRIVFSSDKKLNTTPGYGNFVPMGPFSPTLYETIRLRENHRKPVKVVRRPIDHYDI